MKKLKIQIFIIIVEIILLIIEITFKEPLVVIPAVFLCGLSFGINIKE